MSIPMHVILMSSVKRFLCENPTTRKPTEKAVKRLTTAGFVVKSISLVGGVLQYKVTNNG